MSNFSQEQSRDAAPGMEGAAALAKLGKPCADNVCKALRLGLMSGGKVAQVVVTFIREALASNGEVAQAQLLRELEGAEGYTFDGIGNALLRVDPLIFLRAVAKRLSQHGCWTECALIESQLRDDIKNDAVLDVVLGMVGDPERRRNRRGAMGMSRGEEMFFHVLTERLDEPRVRQTLLAILKGASVDEFREARQVLAQAVEYPEVALYFADHFRRSPSILYDVDTVQLMLNAPDLPQVIGVLAGSLESEKYRNAILDRLAAHVALPEVQGHLARVVLWAEWNNGRYSYRYPAETRARALEIIDKGLLGDAGDCLAETLVCALSTTEAKSDAVSSQIVELLRDRLEVPSMQRALIQGVVSSSTLKAQWCAHLLMGICDRPEIRGLLRDVVLSCASGSADLGISLLQGRLSSTPKVPRWRIGDRDSSTIRPKCGGDYRWE